MSIVSKKNVSIKEVQGSGLRLHILLDEPTGLHDGLSATASRYVLAAMQVMISTYPSNTKLEVTLSQKGDTKIYVLLKK